MVRRKKKPKIVGGRVKKPLPLHYDYEKSKLYCEQLGLVWLGDEFMRNADGEAKDLKFTQDQMDAAVRHSLWHIRYLFTPKNYPIKGRIAIAFHFLFGGLLKSK